ncbi:dual specificity protein phosphatase 23 [Gloeobacter violaceus]|uniref:Glr0006 protein n=1 Tax=Gloeobacter violaceus (strain ATCC 29082 / PCC 7421) TaxID=251221 RepID=Q7NPP9_GLOVI|nr:dual specificity protein phosphatase 23 [Gloeobacter violaceus]BAC87947.1 glr0006 [Gloeobacter violaceus PCC 7421]
MEQSITENLWWVIPGKLGGVRKPTEAEIAELQASGVGGIVSVMDDPGNLDLYERAGLPYRWLPVKGGTAPTREQITQLQDFVEEQNALGAGVAVHCTSGRRRTGTFLAAYLIAQSHSSEEALQIVQTANPDVELREAQIEFLRNFARP